MQRRSVPRTLHMTQRKKWLFSHFLKVAKVSQDSVLRSDVSWKNVPRARHGKSERTLFPSLTWVMTEWASSADLNVQASLGEALPSHSRSHRSCSLPRRRWPTAMNGALCQAWTSDLAPYHRDTSTPYRRLNNQPSKHHLTPLEFGWAQCKAVL